MSDFDKEAERQKLREKYERDKEKRQSTQRMSELLLKGATMTNRHCDECGDPIFRHDGQEFCPGCQNAQVAGGQAADAGSGTAEPIEPTEQSATTEAGAAGDASSESTADAEIGASAESEPGVESGTGAGSDGVSATSQTAESTADDAAESTPDASTAPSTSGVPTRQPAAGNRSQASSERAEQPTGAGRADDLADARASLQRSIVRFAQQAENADDPRRAQELLAASREAAEALGALNR